MVSDEVLFYDLAQTAYSLIYEEGNLINEEGVTVPNFSVFTPFPFTLVNTTLFRQVQGRLQFYCRRPRIDKVLCGCCCKKNYGNLTLYCLIGAIVQQLDWSLHCR